MWNDSVNSYLRDSLAHTLRPFLPPDRQWFEREEEVAIWISVYRVFKVPYDIRHFTGTVREFGQVRAVFTNVNLPFYNMAFGFDPTSEGGIEPRAEFTGWETTRRGILLLLMTPFKSDSSDIDPELAARSRIISARAVIAGVIGLNAAFELVCEFSVTKKSNPSRVAIGRQGPVMENPEFYEVPDIQDQFAYLLIEDILKNIELLDAPTRNRVHLALRWYQRALGDLRAIKMGSGNPDTLINHWIALETLVRVGEQRVAGALIGALSDIHNLSKQEVGQIFPISKVYEQRKKIVHEGELTLYVSFELQQFLSDLFMDILTLHVMKLSSNTPKTKEYLDGSAYTFF